MIRLKLAALLAAGVALGGAPAMAKDPTVLKLSAPWNVDFAPEKCRLTGLFGEEDDRHVLFIEQFYPSTRAGLTVAGSALNRFQSRRRTYLSFYDGQKPHRTEPFAGNVESIGKAVIYSNVDIELGTESDDDDDPNNNSLPQLDTTAAARADFVSISQRGRAVRFATGPLDKAFEVLNTCTQDMVREWGLDVERHLTATRLPEWTNERAIARRIQSEYGSAALNRGEQAILRMRVIVNENGAVEECVLDEATETDRLKSFACREMEAAKFEPALDAEGQPFRSYYATSIIYMIS